MVKRISLTFFILILSVPFVSYAQNDDGVNYEILKKHVQSKYSIKLLADSLTAENIKLPDKALSFSVNELLHSLQTDFKIDYFFYNSYVIVLMSNESVKEKAASTDRKPVQYRFSGQLKDAIKGDKINAGTIFIDPANVILNTNSSGYFECQLDEGIYNIKVIGLGTYENNFELSLYDDVNLEIELFEKTVELEEVVITSKSPEVNLISLRPGSFEFDLNTLKSIPTFLGELDISRAVITLPGVSTVGEGASGFNVRGGSIDQNLILMDGAPLYNSSHLLGFFSIFNPDLIKDFTLYKGLIPADKGGRISSVLEVNQKVPNKEKLGFNAGIGPVSSRVFLDMPIKNKKAGLILAARAAYPTYVLSSFPDESSIKNSSANYFDANLKYDHEFKDGSIITLNGYYSFDEFNITQDTLLSYSNLLGSISYEKPVNEDLKLNFITSYTKYDADIDDATFNQESEFSNGIDQIAFKGTFNYLLNKHNYKAGIEINHYNFRTGKIEPRSQNSETIFQELPDQKAIDLSIFINDEFNISERFGVQLGLRLSSFFNIGEDKFYEFAANETRSRESITDSTLLQSGEVKLLNTNPEPRLAISYRLNSSSSIKASYSRTAQYIHLMSNTVASLPTDLWRPSSPNLESGVSDQISLGYFKNSKSNDYETSFEAFYKEIENTVDFKNGARILLNEELPFQTLQGEATAYGLEALIRKTRGKFTGRIGYTWSRARSRFRSNVADDQLNNGERLPANFDKPHNLNIVGNWKLGRLWRFSTSFTYSSGRPVTLPQSTLIVNGVRVFSDISRNNFRVPDFHRLDMSITLEGSHKKNRRFDTSWTFSVYNLYGRKNVFSVFVDNNDGQAKQLSVLGAPFPSLTFNLTLNK
ncbi:TonB-dependent receptor [Fulvivirga sp. M361]|uniref:TonB-dependent receptor plug domain-containing protein n=1 Tax=Fulvivirga sp. M361 TaxID=2594266 RepID=UPI00117A1C97|nr:TonB-dependent receptor plug domain-containing protein [Fulvivirga sp. M361]TRX62202.1 TonB-dependent receptor [Fulvivirga sp. M361]